VFSRQDSSIAAQSTQTATPVWGIKYFSSVRLYSAPQLHRTTVFMTQICARAGFNSSAPGSPKDTTDKVPMGDRSQTHFRFLR
jgi:hypothetical protein